MPYANPADQRELNRAWYAQRRATDPEFREAEIRRVAAYNQENRSVVTEKQRARRAATRPVFTRTCPECGRAFETTDSRKVYDRHECQVAVNNRKMIERRRSI